MTASLLPAFAALALFGGAAAGTEGSRRGAALEEAFAAYQAGDFSRSAALFRDAAERGDPVAQYNLGVLYQGRQGAPRDDAQAAAWLRKAAEQGDAKAQNELGVMLAAGRGAPRDPESAAAWLRRAAAAGDADAPRNLEALRRAAQPREAGGRRGWWMLGLAGLAAAGLAAWLLAPGAKAAPPPRRSRPPPAGPQAGGALAGGRYELRGQIGEGGMGVVLEGFDSALRRRVALKRMRPELKAFPEERARFLQEARMISRLSHPYIVGIHDILEESDEVYLVFEFVAGRTLSDLLSERGRLGLSESAGILDQVCQAVAAAHRSRVLHRDLKPSNIMLDAEGFAKVMDFGLAREAKDSISRLTQADAVGTPAYMAPEQHMGHGRKASDIYSLAVCLYEMVTGELPFQGPDFLAQKERLKYAPATFIVNGLPRALDDLLASALAPQERERLQDALTFLERLKEAARP